MQDTVVAFAQVPTGVLHPICPQVIFLHCGNLLWDKQTEESCPARKVGICNSLFVLSIISLLQIPRETIPCGLAKPLLKSEKDGGIDKMTDNIPSPIYPAVSGSGYNGLCWLQGHGDFRASTL